MGIPLRQVAGKKTAYDESLLKPSEGEEVVVDRYLGMHMLALIWARMKRDLSGDASLVPIISLI